MINKLTAVFMASCFVNKRNELEHDDFMDLFGELELDELMTVMDVLEVAGIQIVEKATADQKILPLGYERSSKAYSFEYAA